MASHSEPDSNPASTSDLLAKRDPEALEQLLIRYRPLLRAVIEDELEPQLQAKVDPSDLVQDACAEVVRSFAKIESTKSKPFVAFLKRVVINKLNDVRKKLYSQKRDISLESVASATPVSSPAICSTATPMTHLLEIELWERTEAAIAQLPPEVRKVIQLRFEQNMTFSEIGSMLGRSEDDVRISLGRWLKRIRQKVNPNWPSSG